MTGNKERFDQMFRDNRDRIYRLCCLYTSDPDFRKDLMQEIFIKVWENIDKFRGEAAVSTWIYRIAINTCLTHIALLKKESKMRDEFDSEEWNQTSDNPDHQQQMDWMVKCINKLEPADRSLISLYLEDLSHRDIAEILGLTEGNVRVKIHRAKQRLSEMVSKRKDFSSVEPAI